ncbi:alpha/beta hydrolase family protein [Nocardia sp. NBC_00511]|uniref:alpha/beta hydrolase family protein n=1 Tax=Nocardia sp. NBC_00511 TaxID=2903591 RepID=UPI0030E4B3CB
MTIEVHRHPRNRRTRARAGIAGTALLLGTALLSTACQSSTGSAPADERGRLVEVQHLRTYSPDDVRAELTANEFDTGAVKFGVDTYRLTYRTVGADNQATTASGLLALPVDDQHELSTVVYEHGTQPTKSEAPSTTQDSGDLAATLTYASAGFAGVAPDYLGLGLDPNPHPYLDIPSETTASVDMLRAARAQTATLGRQLRVDVAIAGFSQGGPAAMGLARALQANADNNFRATAVAVISGPLDIRNAELPALFDGRVAPAEGAFYTAYLLVSWNRLHGLYRSPGELFQTLYATTVEQLFDGTHAFEDIVAALPPDLDHLLTPQGIALLRNPTGPFATALTTADSTCTDWTPTVPIRLYTGSQDRDVTPNNSADCQTALRARGVEATIVDLGAVDHNGSGVHGTADAVRWFLESNTAN